MYSHISQVENRALKEKKTFNSFCNLPSPQKNFSNVGIKLTWGGHEGLGLTNSNLAEVQKDVWGGNLVGLKKVSGLTKS